MTDERHNTRGRAARLVGYLIVLVLIGVFVSLGKWQLGRADEKRQALALARQASELPALGQESLGMSQEALRFRRVALSGTFEPERQILLDLRKHDDQIGYHVITPLHVAGSDYRVLVNRGWIPQSGQGRGTLPTVVTPDAMVDVTGQLAFPLGKGFRPGISRPGDAAGGVWIYQDVDYFAAAVDYPVAPFVIQLDAASEHGFVREWPEPEFDDGMHIAYAAQWFAFAGFLMVGLLWNLVVKLRQRESKGE